MLGVFVTEDGMGSGDVPVDTQGVIEDADASVRLGMIELITLVLEHGCLTEDGKAMGEAFGNKELPVVILCQLHCDMLTVCRTTLTDIHCDIEDGSLDTAHELALGIWGTLEMESTHHTIPGHTLVVLDKGYRMSEDGGYLLVKLPLGEGLEEIATGILKDLRFEDQYSFNTCFYYFHCSLIRQGW